MTEKQNLISEGKAKSLFETSNADELLMVYRDDTSAFDGKKKEALSGKGAINNKFNAFIMSYLQENGVETHFLKQTSDNESLVKRLDMLPVECVVRNIATGSLCRRLGVKEGIKFEEQPLRNFSLELNQKFVLLLLELYWLQQKLCLLHRIFQTQQNLELLFYHSQVGL